MTATPTAPEAPAFPAPPTLPALAARPRRTWTVALALLVFLTYFLWAGSSYDTRHAALWTFTKAVQPGPAVSDWTIRWSGGWLVPAPGLGHLLIAAAMLIATLSVLAYRTLPAAAAPAPPTPLESPTPRPLWQLLTAAAIFILALAVYLVVRRTWHPLPLDRVLAAARTFTPPTISRAPALLATLATLLLLFLALAAQKRSLWRAALFVFHPLVILEAVSNASPITYFLPPLVLLALGWRFHRHLRELVIISAAAACTWWLAHLALTAPPFNGLLAQCLTLASIEGRPQTLTLIILEALLQTLIVFLALRRACPPLARTLTHILIAWALVSPRVLPADLLPLLALVPLAWNRAAWVLSATILLTYCLYPLYIPNTPWQVPPWLIFVALTPTLVTEAEDLLHPPLSPPQAYNPP